MACEIPVLDYNRCNYNYFYLNDVCRLCWTTNGLLEISSYSFENNTTFAENIREVVGVDVTTYTHIKNICSRCLKQIEIITQFKKFCQETDKKLNDILEKGPTQYQQSFQPSKIFLNPKNDLELNLELLEKKKERIEIDILKMELDSELLESDWDISNIKKIEGDDLILTIPETTESDIDLGLNDIFYCFACHMHFESKKMLTEHELIYHGINKSELYRCFGCKKKFANNFLRQLHEKKYCIKLRNVNNIVVATSRGIETCHICSEQFKSSGELKDHIFSTHHKEKTSFICEICGKLLNSKSNLVVHKVTHESVKPLKCPHCEYRAAQLSSLTIHIRTHTGERPYPCDLCPKRCISSSNLIKHRRLHSALKHFGCHICKKRFRQKSEVNEHIAIVHKNLKRHACDHCGTEYTRFTTLREHLLVKHGVKVKRVKGEVVEVASGIDYKRKKKTTRKRKACVPPNADGADVIFIVQI